MTTEHDDLHQRADKLVQAVIDRMIRSQRAATAAEKRERIAALLGESITPDTALTRLKELRELAYTADRDAQLVRDYAVAVGLVDPDPWRGEPPY